MEPLKVLTKYCFITILKQNLLLQKCKIFEGKKLWRNNFFSFRTENAAFIVKLALDVLIFHDYNLL